jgi:hypothetical protein
VTSDRPEKEISRLVVGPNAVLTLAGGDVTVSSRTLAAPGDVRAAASAAGVPIGEFPSVADPAAAAAGRVNVVAVADGDALVQCDPSSTNAPLDIVPGRGGARLGAVTLTDKGTIDASGVLFDPDNDARSGGFGGRVDVRTGSFSMTGGARVQAESSANISGAAGLGIDVRADDDVTITESLISTKALNASDAGRVSVAGRSVAIAGNGGDADRTFELPNMGIAVDTDVGAAGRGGDLTVVADDAFTLRFGAAVRSVSNGTGDGGNVSIQARDALIDNGTSTEFTVVAAQTSGIRDGGLGGSV